LPRRHVRIRLVFGRYFRKDLAKSCDAEYCKQMFAVMPEWPQP